MSYEHSSPTLPANGSWSANQPTNRPTNTHALGLHSSFARYAFHKAALPQHIPPLVRRALQPRPIPILAGYTSTFLHSSRTPLDHPIDPRPQRSAATVPSLRSGSSIPARIGIGRGRALLAHDGPGRSPCYNSEVEVLATGTPLPSRRGFSFGCLRFSSIVTTSPRRDAASAQPERIVAGASRRQGHKAL